MNSKKTWQGFTLLELLVALVIFAVIGVMAYGGLNTILSARIQTDQHATQLARLQMAFTWLGRDIEQYIERTIRDQYGERQPALKGTTSQLELTRAGWRNPALQQRSSLQRIAYFIEDETLWRSYWRLLDRAQNARPIKMDLINNINEITLRYLDNNFKWHEHWPITSKTVTLKAIEVTLVVEWGPITRLFKIL